MPKIDFPNGKIPKDYKLPEPPIKLVKNMEHDDILAYINQELYKIYNCKENWLVKEMMKEDIYDNLIKNSYDLEEMFSEED